ncbi:unnamed protein product [Larinioides sclopetarius]|uniref:Uncharacterized protein n=1 Tax=Larinioides sclopetarius TaxID=280406 RepID=A0AAV1YRD5_9ARAC
MAANSQFLQPGKIRRLLCWMFESTALCSSPPGIEVNYRSSWRRCSQRLITLELFGMSSNSCSFCSEL